MFYLAATGSPAYKIKYMWLPPGGTWNGPATVDAHTDSPSIYSTKLNGSGDLKRSNSADPSDPDYFVSNAFPRVAVNPVSGNIYLVYADLPFLGSTTDRGDIWANEASGSGSLTWSGTRKINNDATMTDQWNPAVAVNPAGTLLFIGYYSRQGDPINNSLIKPTARRPIS